MICVILAHPYLHRSHANRALADAARTIEGVELRSLYDLYPDFDIDVAAEQQALSGARLVVWMHPVFWYSVPGLMKHWFEKVLAYGWAYGEGGTALHGKRCLWVPTAGGNDGDYREGGDHGNRFATYGAVVEQTARYCGMQWEEPHVVLGANRIADDALAAHAAALAARLAAFRDSAMTGTGVAP